MQNAVMGSSVAGELPEGPFTGGYVPTSLWASNGRRLALPLAGGSPISVFLPLDVDLQPRKRPVPLPRYIV